MNYIDKFNNYNNLVSNDIYYSNLGAQNILFVGGCRSYVYSIFFEEICKYIPYFQNAQFGFSVIGTHMIDLLKRQKTKNLCFVFENADYIVCEQIRNYNFLNSSKTCEQNIFNNFNIKPTCKIIQVPNLDFRYYANELIYNNSDDINNENIIDEIKKNNLQKFINHCKKYKFYQLADYIETNINTKRFFIKFNHPCNHLIIEFMKNFIQICFENQLPDNVIHILEQIRIFDIDEIHKTNIIQIDYQLGLQSNVK